MFFNDFRRSALVLNLFKLIFSIKDQGDIPCAAEGQKPGFILLKINRGQLDQAMAGEPMRIHYGLQQPFNFIHPGMAVAADAGN